MSDLDGTRWLDASTFGSHYEVQIDANSHPAKYRHRRQGIHQWGSNRRPFGAELDDDRPWIAGQPPEHDAPFAALADKLRGQPVTGEARAEAIRENERNRSTFVPRVDQTSEPPPLVDRLRQEGNACAAAHRVENHPLGKAELYREAAAELEDWSKSFALYHSANMRGIKAWQAAHPGNDTVWPDTGKLVEWLLERHTIMAAQLLKDAAQFKFYGDNHRAKALAMQPVGIITSERDAVLAKADVNDECAKAAMLAANWPANHKLPEQG